MTDLDKKILKQVNNELNQTIQDLHLMYNDMAKMLDVTRSESPQQIESNVLQELNLKRNDLVNQINSTKQWIDALMK